MAERQSLFEAVKSVLHIKVSDFYDEDIRDLIEEAKLELIRGGVNKEKAQDEDNLLVRAAVKAYCQEHFTEDPRRRQIFNKSFTYQMDCLRKSKGFKTDGV